MHTQALAKTLLADEHQTCLLQKWHHLSDLIWTHSQTSPGAVWVDTSETVTQTVAPLKYKSSFSQYLMLLKNAPSQIPFKPHQNTDFPWTKRLFKKIFVLSRNGSVSNKHSFLCSVRTCCLGGALLVGLGFCHESRNSPRRFPCIELNTFQSFSLWGMRIFYLFSAFSFPRPCMTNQSGVWLTVQSWTLWDLKLFSWQNIKKSFLGGIKLHAGASWISDFILMSSLISWIFSQLFWCIFCI